jgi:hypothetical protein
MTEHPWSDLSEIWIQSQYFISPHIIISYNISSSDQNPCSTTQRFMFLSFVLGI